MVENKQIRVATTTELLSILVCPETHQKVTLADSDLLGRLNSGIQAGALKTRHGESVAGPIDEALVREDGKCVYLVDDGIPNMLIDERVDL